MKIVCICIVLFAFSLPGFAMMPGDTNVIPPGMAFGDPVNGVAFGISFDAKALKANPPPTKILCTACLKNLASTPRFQGEFNQTFGVIFFRKRENSKEYEPCFEESEYMRVTSYELKAGAIHTFTFEFDRAALAACLSHGEVVAGVGIRDPGPGKTSETFVYSQRLN